MPCAFFKSCNAFNFVCCIVSSKLQGLHTNYLSCLRDLSASLCNVIYTRCDVMVITKINDVNKEVKVLGVLYTV